MEIAVALGMVALAITLLSIDRIPIEVSSLTIVVLLALSRLVSPAEALAGFSSETAIFIFALLAMTLSLDDFVITFFTSGPETLTFPVKVYSMVRFGATPEVNAASTILIALTIVLTVIAMRLQRPTETAEAGA